MTKENWKKTTSDKVEKCWECLKEILIGDEYYHLWKKRPWCVQCREEKIKQKAAEYLSELRQIWDDLEPKVKDDDLDIVDCQRIYALKNKISELLKTPNTEDFLTYWEVKIDFETFRKSLTELDNFIKENASPQTQDKSSGDKSRNRKANKVCSHENIEPYEDDPSNYCCSYCWDGKSEEFLAVLARKGLKQGKKNPNQQEIEELKAKIKELESKINKTSEEKAELTDKQSQLDKLTNNNEQTNDNSWLIPTLIIGGGILLVGLVIFLTKNKKNKH